MGIWERAKDKAQSARYRAADAISLVSVPLGLNRANRQSEREAKALDAEIRAEAERRGWTPFQVTQEVERDYAAKPFDQPKEREVLRMPDAEPSEQGLRYWAGKRQAERKEPEVPAPDDVNLHWDDPLPDIGRPGAEAADPFGPRAAHSAEAMEAEMCDLPEPGDFPCCAGARHDREAGS